MEQLDLNLMLECAVPTSKNTRSVCIQPGRCVFCRLHTNKNPSHVIHEHTVHEDVSLGTRYTLASTSNTQVTRVHTGKKGDTQVRSPLSTGALWYHRGINHRSIGLSARSMIIIMCFTNQFAISKKVTPPWVR